MQLLLEAHDHVHAVALFLMVHEDVLLVVRRAPQADHAPQNPLTCHVNFVDFDINLLSLRLGCPFTVWRPSVGKYVRSLSCTGRSI